MTTAPMSGRDTAAAFKGLVIGFIAIAIVVLIPLNYFQAKLGRLQFDLENVATQVELLVLHPGVQTSGAPLNVPQISEEVPDAPATPKSYNTANDHHSIP
jgi:hypothetical protein